MVGSLLLELLIDCGILLVYHRGFGKDRYQLESIDVDYFNCGVFSPTNRPLLVDSQTLWLDQLNVYNFVYGSCVNYAQNSIRGEGYELTVLLGCVNKLFVQKHLSHDYALSLHHPAIVGLGSHDVSLVKVPNLEVLLAYGDKIALLCEDHLVNLSPHLVLAYS